ncbi:UDP-N-acetylmuramate--L-alanine ligase [Bdellovibrionota bacterium FG-1]
MHKRYETPLHFVGIGGIGMSGIAEVFLNQGYPVTGSDQAESETTRHLAQIGARISIGHRAENVVGAKVVVISSAVRPTNPEVVEAKRLRIPIIPRAEMLGELMRGRTGIAVAGTHGKTTTTSMLATVLMVAGLDPTIVIGGKVDSLGGNAKLGQGRFLVAEADESDGSFLHLPATLAIITNIDNDHLDHYGSLEAIDHAFVAFIGELPFYGVAAVCGEDPGVRRILNRVSKPIVTYGLSDEWDYSARTVKIQGLGSTFEVFSRSRGQVLGQVRLHVPGEHNVLNALAAVAIGMHMGIDFSMIARGLEQFKGVKRRFEIRWQDQAGKRVIVDDYAHHPTELAATLAAARGYWPGRIITVFQPHRYSRTLHCRDGFLSAFHKSDVVLITDIYAAGEDPIEGVDSARLVAAIRKVANPGQEIVHVGDLLSAGDEVLKRMTSGDLVLCCGAGSITRLPERLIEALGQR